MIDQFRRVGREWCAETVCKKVEIVDVACRRPTDPPASSNDDRRARQSAVQLCVDVDARTTSSATMPSYNAVYGGGATRCLTINGGSTSLHHTSLTGAFFAAETNTVCDYCTTCLTYVLERHIAPCDSFTELTARNDCVAEEVTTRKPQICVS